jgi:phosphoribosyl-ATP pyrophosphohydrolase
MEDAFRALYDTIIDRKLNPAEGSYTCYLFNQGLDKILKKVGEECAETIIASKNSDKEAVINEISDLFFHVSVLMAEKDITPEDIAFELNKRSGKTGNLKQFHTTDKNT